MWSVNQAVLIALFLVGGGILGCLGIVGEYVGRIYEQVKARPLYLLKEASPDSAALPVGLESAGRGKRRRHEGVVSAFHLPARGSRTTVHSANEAASFGGGVRGRTSLSRSDHNAFHPRKGKTVAKR